MLGASTSANPGSNRSSGGAGARTNDRAGRSCDEKADTPTDTCADQSSAAAHEQRGNHDEHDFHARSLRRRLSAAISNGR
jgi:hypothetical protein